jgi:hypothetical protein
MKSSFDFTLKLPGTVNANDNYQVSLHPSIILDFPLEYNGTFNLSDSGFLNCFIDNLRVNPFFQYQ